VRLAPTTSRASGWQHAKVAGEAEGAGGRVGVEGRAVDIVAGAVAPVGTDLLSRTGFTDGDMLFMSAVAVPPEVDHGFVEGDFSSQVAGARVELDCERARAGGVELSEIVVVAEVDERGADFEGLEVHYHLVDDPDRRYVLEVDWRMTACGSDIDDPEVWP
jgi:hypothetical protein